MNLLGGFMTSRVLKSILMASLYILSCQFLFSQSENTVQSLIFSKVDKNSVIVKVQEKGTYRFSWTNLKQVPLEFSLAQKAKGSSDWQTIATNRNIRSGLDMFLDADLQPDQEYLFVILLPLAIKDPIKIEYSPLLFSDLKNKLKQDLTYTLPSTPLKKLFSFSIGVHADLIKSVTDQHGRYYFALRDSKTQTVSLWNENAQPLGKTATPPEQAVEDFSLTLTETGNPLIVYREQTHDANSGSLSSRYWNGLSWINLITPGHGYFSLVSIPETPPVLIFQESEGLQISTWENGHWGFPITISGPTAASQFSSIVWGTRLAVFLANESKSNANRCYFFNKDLLWQDSGFPEIPNISSTQIVSTRDNLWILIITAQDTFLYKYSATLGWSVFSLPPTTGTKDFIFNDNESLHFAAVTKENMDIYTYEASQWTKDLTLNNQDFEILPIIYPRQKLAKQGSLSIIKVEENATVITCQELP